MIISICDNEPVSAVKAFFMKDNLYYDVFSSEQVYAIDNHFFKWSEDNWLMFKSANKLTTYGVVKYRLINDCLFEFHPYVTKEIRGTEMSYELHRHLIKWVRDNTLCHKLITFIPENLKIVRQAAINHELIEEGRIYSGAYWNKQLQDLIIYTQLITNITN